MINFINYKYSKYIIPCCHFCFDWFKEQVLINSLFILGGKFLDVGFHPVNCTVIDFNLGKYFILKKTVSLILKNFHEARAFEFYYDLKYTVNRILFIFVFIFKFKKKRAKMWRGLTFKASNLLFFIFSHYRFIRFLKKSNDRKKINGRLINIYISYRFT